jgi:hypothetical protein
MSNNVSVGQGPHTVANTASPKEGSGVQGSEPKKIIIPAPAQNSTIKEKQQTVAHDDKQQVGNEDENKEIAQNDETANNEINLPPMENPSNLPQELKDLGDTHSIWKV